MKPYNSSRMLVCDYDHESGKFSISLNGGRFETPSEEVFVNQLHKMLGAPHQSVDVALLNKHVTVQRTFVNQHLYLSLDFGFPDGVLGRFLVKDGNGYAQTQGVVPVTFHLLAECEVCSVHV